MSPHKSSEAIAATEATKPVVETDTLATNKPLFIAALGVRWRDLDAFNHVNNSNFLTYLEEARLQWLQHKHDWFDETSMPVLAASELQYRHPIPWPASLHIELRCTRLGNSSITIAHRIVNAGNPDCLYCDGHVVMVWMNPVTGKPVALPPSIRTAAGAANY